MKLILISILGVLSLIGSFNANSSQDDEWSRSDRHSIRFAKGVVSKKETAIAIAKAILIEKGLIDASEHLNAKKYDGFWLVFLTQESKSEAPLLGGTVEVEIDQQSGTILRIDSTK